MIKMAISLKKASSEQDFLDVLDIESRICASSKLNNAPYHIGGLIFDRFLFKGGAPDYFDYGQLVFLDDTLIGYAMCFLDEDENEYYFGLLPEYSSYYSEVIKLIDDLFKCTGYTTVANTNDAELTKALSHYSCSGEERYQAGIDLKKYNTQEVLWQNETIRFLKAEDIENRAEYGYIPTGEDLTTELYRSLMDSPYYSKAMDYVIFDNKSGQFAGFVSWWLDEKSNTALLEPVACLPDFRRRGIMKRALLYGLNELKKEGFSYAYVSTSLNNDEAISLYKCVGFEKIGTANEYIRQELN